jgi:glycosyltransferase involved in cell wall biosynthesis
VKILYLNHTAHVSGAERSLLTLLGGIGGRASVAAACPRGPLADACAALDVRVHPVPGTDGSLKLHPRYTTQTLLDLARAAGAVRRLVARHRFDIVHANSIRAGLVAAMAGIGDGAPAVVHVRDCLPDGAVTDATRRVLCARTAAVIANSAYTLERFAVPGVKAFTRVIHNPVDLKRMDEARVDRETARRRLGLHPTSGPVLGVVAQLTPWKAQDDAVRIVAALRASHPDIQLLLAGSAKFVSRATRYDNRAFVGSLVTLIRENELEDRVHLLGERDDVPAILAALDVLLLPSWEEPFGRAVAEGMAMGVPVAATSVGGPREILDDGVEGLLLPPQDPDAWARALAPLLDRPARLSAMGRAGRERAARDLDVPAHVERVLEVYDRVVCQSHRISAASSH